MPTLRPTARRFLVLVALALVATVGAPAPAHAVLGDYSVRLTATNSPHWFETGRGPFIGTNMRVYTGIGSFQAADYGAWRVVVPGDGARIVGGRIATTLSTPHANVKGRIIAGSGSAPPVVFYDGGGDGEVVRTISGVHDWVQVDLRAIGPVATKRVSENSIVMTSVELTMRDSVTPIITPLVLPAPSTWHAAGTCIPVMFRLGDQGGGLANASIVRSATGVAVASWNATRIESTRPGPVQYDLSTCIGPQHRDHGDTEFTVTTTDVGGRSTSSRFVLRADQIAPRIGEGPGDGTRLAGPEPGIEFTVEDSGSGLASIAASVDGSIVPVVVDGRRARVVTGHLGVGPHAVSLVATDHAGNRDAVTRRFSTVDEVAPTLVLESPTGRGESTAWLSVRASDAYSGVAPATWRVAVNGETVSLDVDGGHATATIGPLAPGVQRIEIQVADVVGNVARLTHAYEVVSAAAPSMPNVGAQSGIWIAEEPTTALTYGTRSAIVAYVARNGRPMSGQIVQVRRNGSPIGSTRSDTDGVARIAFPVGAPGSYDATVVGVEVAPAPITLRVAPRITLGVVRAKVRVGQRVPIAGVVAPGMRGRRVAVEARIGGVWYPIRRAASVGADGRFRSTVMATTRGTVWIRVRMLAVGSWAPAISNVRVIRAR